MNNVKFGKKRGIVGREWTTLDVKSIPTGTLTQTETPKKIVTTQKGLLQELTAPHSDISSINISINRYYTDTQGVLIPKNAVNSELKTKVPFFLWGKADYEGGFRHILNALHPQNMFFLYRFIVGTQYDWFGNQGGEIATKYKPGDLVLIFGDSLTNLTTLIYIVVSCDSTSYGSLLKETVKGGLDLQKFNYALDNTNNFNESFAFVNMSNICLPKTDWYQPYQNQTPQLKQSEFMEIPVHFKINSKIGFGSYIQFDTEFMNFSFKVKHLI